MSSTADEARAVGDQFAAAVRKHLERTPWQGAGTEPSPGVLASPPDPRREPRRPPDEVRLDPRVGAPECTRPLEDPPSRPRGRQRPAGVREPVLAELRDLDPGDRPQRSAGRRRGLPRLRRLGPAVEPAQRPGALGGDPLVSPAGRRVPWCPSTGPGRAVRRGQRRARPASRPAASGRRSGDGRAAPTRRRAPARGPRRRRGPPASARRDPARSRVPRARRRGRRGPPRAAAPGHRHGPALRDRRAGRRRRVSRSAYRRSTWASSRPSERTSFSLWITTPARGSTGPPRSTSR